MDFSWEEERAAVLGTIAKVYEHMFVNCPRT